MSFRASAGFQAHAKMHGRQQTKPAQIVSHNVRHVPTDNGHPPNGPTSSRSTLSRKNSVRPPPQLSGPEEPADMQFRQPRTAPARSLSSTIRRNRRLHPPTGTKTNGESRTNRFSPFSMVRSISGPRTNAQRYSFAAFLTYLSSHPKNSRFHSSEFCGLKT